jgi:hypothetical protein
MKHLCDIAFALATIICGSEKWSCDMEMQKGKPYKQEWIVSDDKMFVPKGKGYFRVAENNSETLLVGHCSLEPERKFWRCVESGEPPKLFGVEPPKPPIEAVRIVDMSASNSWAESAGLFRSTRQAFLDHERSKAELKSPDARGCQGGDRSRHPR